ncbi:MAG: hypothetical protein DWC02_05000 [Candidatus Poseidoniales archaeon]|nr:MAG: hypothetical protein DWC02_05000 [Candidatus Poseidoniales archaeon]
MDDSGEDMAAKPKKDPLAKLLALPGVGKATAKKLNDAGIKSPAGIVKAGEKGLVKAGLSAMISKKLLSVVSKEKPAKKAATKKAPAKKSKAKKAVSKAKDAVKKAAISKATAASRKVAKEAIKSSIGSKTVKSSKSNDGRKGKTLKIPGSVKDMPWFNKK